MNIAIVSLSSDFLSSQHELSCQSSNRWIASRRGNVFRTQDASIDIESIRLVFSISIIYSTIQGHKLLVRFPFSYSPVAHQGPPAHETY